MGLQNSSPNHRFHLGKLLCSNRPRKTKALMIRGLCENRFWMAPESGVLRSRLRYPAKGVAVSSGFTHPPFSIHANTVGCILNLLSHTYVMCWQQLGRVLFCPRLALFTEKLVLCHHTRMAQSAWFERGLIQTALIRVAVTTAPAGRDISPAENSPAIRKVDDCAGSPGRGLS